MEKKWKLCEPFLDFIIGFSQMSGQEFSFCFPNIVCDVQMGTSLEEMSVCFVFIH
jgi:hypothetical protein